MEGRTPVKSPQMTMAWAKGWSGSVDEPLHEVEPIGL